MAIARTPVSAPMRRARRAWNLLHLDPPAARRLAEQVLAGPPADEPRARGWAELVRGFHLLYYATATEAARVLRRAARQLEAAGDRGGALLAQAGIARSLWRNGDFRAALAHVLPLRDEGVRVLRHEQRGVLLNSIAGCYSALGQSEQAFAYMFEALRDAGPRRGRGFDAALHCNLSHELLQIGDYEQALRHVDEGLQRCQQLHNARLESVLRINRVIGLTALGRAADALADIDAVLGLPADTSGRGAMASGFETLAVAALRAGDAALGAELLARPVAPGVATLPDETVERAAAQALLALAHGRAPQALAALVGVWQLAQDDTVDGLSVRVRALFFGVAAETAEAAGDPPRALAALREVLRLQQLQAQSASRARYQAATLQTELLRLQHRLDENDARRRATERARAELAAANAELSRTVEEVQALQAALRQQATQDPLTGLFNRRHLNDALPTLFALARRDAHPMALAIVDLDHFKAVNDQHGHAAGDRLLAAFGTLLAGQCRRSDVACRYGGEEFCLLMPRTGAQAGRRKLQALLRRWRAQVFQLGNVHLQGLSFSAGVADTLEIGSHADDLLRTADIRLLAAKRAGRGRVEAGHPGPHIGSAASR